MARSSDIALANRLADAARAAIVPLYRGAWAEERKADQSFVTEADRAAEAAMRAILEAEAPDDGIIGEEYGTVREGAARQWVLDPIDGTTSFIAGRPIFGTLIALLQEGWPVLGVIDQPVLGERWLGAAGKATTLNGAAVRSRPCRELGDARLATTSPHLFSAGEADHFMALAQAVQAVSKAVRRARAGLQDPNRPLGSFLFLGPTGVGKTELTKALASFLFDDDSAMVRIDMSEYMEKHAVARLIGAPPGYVGYDEGGVLTEAVRRRPYQVVLFDEVEKAHSDVFNVLLQVLDDGRLTDGQGRVVDFTNTLIILTSNIGSPMIQSMAGQPYEDVKDAVFGELKNHFRPEFLNRIDEIVVFHGLDASQIVAIAKIQLKVLSERLARMDLHLNVSEQALAELAKVGFDPVFGARPLKRAIQQRLENPLSKLLLEGKFPPKTTIDVSVDPINQPGVFQFNAGPEAVAG